MDKTEREKYLIEVKLKEIEAIDKDISTMWLKLLVGFGGVFTFLYVNKILKVYNWLGTGAIGVIIVSFILWAQFQSDKYTGDCYNSLFNAIKDNNILDYKIPHDPWHIAFIYKKKF